MRCHFSCAMLCSLLACLVSYVSAATTDIPSAASFYIPSIPYIHGNADIPLQMYGGHLSADPNRSNAASTDVTSHLYFFMVKNRRTADKQRLIFWFNGGPGCSSFDGVMMEVGPWRWNDKTAHEFWVKHGGWEEYSTMVFIDQPAGTGFSYTSTDRYVHNMDVLLAQLIEFLKNFYQVFPEYKTIDTFLAGESFAGQWIPYIADAMLESSLNIPLRGIAIGNGWIDPKEQYLTYLDFTSKSGLLEENSEGWKKVKESHDKCADALAKSPNNTMYHHDCREIMFAILRAKEFKQDEQKMCINMYDIRLTDKLPACGMNWPPEIHAITKFLDLPEVVSALHATAHPGSWVECKHMVHSAFQTFKTEASVSLLPKLLSKIRVLIFAGDQDLICNYVGLEAMIKKLTWNGGTGLGTGIQTQPYTVNSKPAGTWVTSRNLTYVKLFNASHMAPFDHPQETHDMMLRFMGVNFATIVDGSARIPSAIGSDVKPIFVEDNKTKPGAPVSAKTPQQDKAMWEAYYNAGSAALVLVIVFLVIGGFVWCHQRRKRVQLPSSQSLDEESIPLTSTRRDDEEEDEAMRRRMAKGKDRARIEDESSSSGQIHGGVKRVEEEERIFDVGDSDDEDYKHTK